MKVDRDKLTARHPDSSQQAFNDSEAIRIIQPLCKPLICQGRGEAGANPGRGEVYPGQPANWPIARLTATAMGK